MKVWITTVGSSPFAVINTLWAACELEGYVPEKLYLVANGKVEQEVKVVNEWTKRIIEAYGEDAIIERIHADEVDFINFSRILSSCITEEKKKGNEVAVDMTPGRKFMSAFSMSNGLAENGADRVYYLHLSDVTKYKNRPFIEIPANEQRLYDMKKVLLEK
ncbi:hypothetical protein ANME2D_00449 [Candidatus Methanoperedens nitroreducens]|uniref:CRISPR system ring nuclease SSO2081-like domain-containing protein n=2 Tax=Candidatus Methanoperedens nitratireducens TaxID=1392998 RepID=A0A062VA52_9EURY|nr:hypothetical protein ANME2D_00449 [Candidatus Methanoperedens nitroreducens]